MGNELRTDKTRSLASDGGHWPLLVPFREIVNRGGHGTRGRRLTTTIVPGAFATLRVLRPALSRACHKNGSPIVLSLVNSFLTHARSGRAVLPGAAMRSPRSIHRGA